MTEDPTRTEERLRGALRGITPAMRADWAAADRRERRWRMVLRIVMALALAAVALIAIKGMGQ